MKFTSQEEYGLRCLLRLAGKGEAGWLTIPEISEEEGISGFYVAKLLRILRRAGFIKSARGQEGGYSLARPAKQILVGEVLATLGGRLFDPDFCDRHTGLVQQCAHSNDCSIRTLWRTVQLVVDQVLGRVTLADLEAHSELEMAPFVSNLIHISENDRARLRPQAQGLKN